MLTRQLAYMVMYTYLPDNVAVYVNPRLKPARSDRVVVHRLANVTHLLSGDFIDSINPPHIRTLTYPRSDNTPAIIITDSLENKFRTESKLLQAQVQMVRHCKYKSVGGNLFEASNHRKRALYKQCYFVQKRVTVDVEQNWVYQIRGPEHQTVHVSTHEHCDHQKLTGQRKIPDRCIESRRSS